MHLSIYERPGWHTIRGAHYMFLPSLIVLPPRTIGEGELSGQTDDSLRHDVLQFVHYVLCHFFLALQRKIFFAFCTDDGDLIGVSLETCTLVLQTVEDDKIKSLADVKKWKSKRGKANGTVLFDKMMKLKYAYDVDYRFCSKENAGLEIVNLLMNYSEPI